MKIKLLALSIILIILGSINWGLIGVFGFDLVAAVLGFSPLVVRIVYALVGAAGVYVGILSKDILALMSNNLLK